jgi:hypothetical protein
VAGDERRAVVEAHAAAQMEGVYFSIGRHVPTFGERRFKARVGCESRQSIEDVRYRASARHIRRDCGIERLRIVGVPGIDQRAPLRSGFAAAAGDGGEQKQRGEKSVHGSDRCREMHDRAPLTRASAPVNLIAP